MEWSFVNMGWSFVTMGWCFVSPFNHLEVRMDRIMEGRREESEEKKNVLSGEC